MTDSAHGRCSGGGAMTALYYPDWRDSQSVKELAHSKYPGGLNFFRFHNAVRD